MKKKLTLVCFVILMLSLFLCSCAAANHDDDPNAVPMKFQVEGTRGVKTVYVIAEGKNTGEKIKLEIDIETKKGINKEGKEVDMPVPVEIKLKQDYYFIQDVYTNNKKINISLNDSLIPVNEFGGVHTFTVKEQTEIGGLEWMWMNNKLYIIGIAGCFLTLLVIRKKKEKKMQEG